MSAFPCVFDVASPATAELIARSRELAAASRTLLEDFHLRQAICAEVLFRAKAERAARARLERDLGLPATGDGQRLTASV